MSNELDRRPPLCEGTLVVSLVAAITGVWASDALASRATAEPRVGEQELSTRVATIVERVRLIDPTLVRDLPPEKKMAQWRNY
jgi:hypothetical protein